jgi:hypothetical protein
MRQKGGDKEVENDMKNPRNVEWRVVKREGVEYKAVGLECSQSCVTLRSLQISSDVLFLHPQNEQVVVNEA